MSRYTRPTVGARVVRSESFTIPKEPSANLHDAVLGGRAVISLHEDMTSQGYKSGYQAIPTRWVVGTSFRPDGRVFMRTAQRYTGNRYEKAEQDYQAMRAGIIRQGAIPDQLEVFEGGAR